MLKNINLPSETYLEPVEGTSHWYKGCSKMYDVYEAQEILLYEENFEGNDSFLVSFPEGKIYEPITPRENLFIDGFVVEGDRFAMMTVDFEKDCISIYSFDPVKEELHTLEEISLSVVKDCYNLRLKGHPLMLTRSPNEDVFQILWPVRKDIPIDEREVFDLREGDALYFSMWYEDPVYRTETIVRDFHSLKERERFAGSVMRMPDGSIWKIENTSLKE